MEETIPDARLIDTAAQSACAAAENYLKATFYENYFQYTVYNCFVFQSHWGGNDV
jgi:hypothetical protein